MLENKKEQLAENLNKDKVFPFRVLLFITLFFSAQLEKKRVSLSYQVKPYRLPTEGKKNTFFFSYASVFFFSFAKLKKKRTQSPFKSSSYEKKVNKKTNLAPFKPI